MAFLVQSCLAPHPIKSLYGGAVDRNTIRRLVVDESRSRDFVFFLCTKKSACCFVSFYSFVLRGSIGRARPYTTTSSPQHDFPRWDSESWNGLGRSPVTIQTNQINWNWTKKEKGHQSKSSTSSWHSKPHGKKTAQNRLLQGGGARKWADGTSLIAVYGHAASRTSGTWSRWMTAWSAMSCLSDRASHRNLDSIWGRLPPDY